MGEEVHLGARIAAAGHGGQVLLSKQTREAIDGDRETSDLGEHRLKEFSDTAIGRRWADTGAGMPELPTGSVAFLVVFPRADARRVTLTGNCASGTEWQRAE